MSASLAAAAASVCTSASLIARGGAAAVGAHDDDISATPKRTEAREGAIELPCDRWEHSFNRKAPPGRSRGAAGQSSKPRSQERGVNCCDAEARLAVTSKNMTSGPQVMSPPNLVP